MDERVLQFRVGVVMFASILLVVVLAVAFNFVPPLWRGRYNLHILFPEAPGVTQNSPVRKSGILIGRVEQVELRKQGVLVTCWVDSQYEIYESEQCRIGVDNLLGDAVLEFVPGEQPPPPEPKAIPDGTLMRGDVSSNPLKVLTGLEDELTSTMLAFRDTSTDVGKLANNLNSVIENNQDQLGRVIRKSETAIEKFDETMTTINNLLSDDELQVELREALAEMPELITESRALVAESRSAMVKFKEVAEGAGKTLNNTNELTKDLPQTSRELSRQLGDVLAELSVFSRALNQPDGTVGQLVHNPELYQRLNRAAGNVEQVTQRMRPIVEDVRVFTDKIARDPGRLGVKGALQRNQTGTKYLPMSHGFQAAPLATPPVHAPLDPYYVPLEQSPQTYWQSQ